MIRRTLMFALVLAAQGCTLRPEPTNEALRAEVLANLRLPPTWQAGEAGAGPVATGWLEKFDDQRLHALVAEALAYNTDLTAAAARVEQAAALVRVAGGELYPAVSAVGRAGAESSSDDTGLQGVVVGASWELDVWGRVRYGVRGSKDQLFSVQADYTYARQSLAALVAKSWLLAIEASLQRKLSNDMVTAAAKILELTASRQRVGAGSEADVTAARVSVRSYQDSVLQMELSRAQALRALEALLGRYPAADVAVADRLPPMESTVPLGLPSELLERRPDVIAAEWRVGAAFNRTQQARAARLPSFSLTGSATDLSSDLFVLQDRDNPVWGLGGKVFAPLFAGGALKAQVDVRTAEQKQAMAAYASTALKAFDDVENALSSMLALQAREAVLTAALADSGHALRFAESRYRVGSGDLRSVQQQLLSLQAARMSLLRVQSERRIQRVNLHLALGGDFSESA